MRHYFNGPYAEALGNAGRCGPADKDEEARQAGHYDRPGRAAATVAAAGDTQRRRGRRERKCDR